MKKEMAGKQFWNLQIISLNTNRQWRVCQQWGKCMSKTMCIMDAPGRLRRWKPELYMKKEH